MSLNRGMLRLSGDLVRGNVELMEVLGSAVAQRDSGTAMHNYRVCYFSVCFAEALGLDNDAMRTIIAGGPRPRRSISPMAAYSISSTATEGTKTHGDSQWECSA